MRASMMIRFSGKVFQFNAAFFAYGHLYSGAIHSQETKPMPCFRGEVFREKFNPFVYEFYKSRMAKFLSCLAEGTVYTL